MFVKNSQWYWAAELPDKVCDAIIEEGELATKETAKVAGKQVREDIRKSDVSWIQPLWLRNLLWSYTMQANLEAGWNFKISRFETFQYTTYRAPGGHYDWHIDNAFPYKDGPNKGLIRKLSLTIQLSDPEDYEGGMFEQRILRKNDEGDLNAITNSLESIKPRGSLLVFPGFVYHRVMPVTKGTRHSLVAWAVGTPFE